jgi:hypothetical protein
MKGSKDRRREGVAFSPKADDSSTGNTFTVPTHRSIIGLTTLPAALSNTFSVFNPNEEEFGWECYQLSSISV